MGTGRRQEHGDGAHGQVEPAKHQPFLAHPAENHGWAGCHIPLFMCSQNKTGKTFFYSFLKLCTIKYNGKTSQTWCLQDALHAVCTIYDGKKDQKDEKNVLTKHNKSSMIPIKTRVFIITIAHEV